MSNNRFLCVVAQYGAPQRHIAEEREQLRKIREAERLAKMEAKRVEKEALAKERAEAQAREQARREVEREKARLAKRYPLPDEVRYTIPSDRIVYNTTPCDRYMWSSSMIHGPWSMMNMSYPP